MVKENIYIDILDKSDLEGFDSVHIINCLINKIDLIGVFELNTDLTIENCIIRNLNIHSCWFVKGFILKNSIVKNSIDYQMGGHNKNSIIFEGNIFKDFFNFFDCQFENIIEIRNNIFEKGTNLLGNVGEGFENVFISGYLVENNLGDINVNR